MNQRRRRRGFTLMELVVTTAIVGTLAAFAVPSYIEAGNNAKGAKSLDNLNTIGSAILQEYAKVAPLGVGSNAIATFSVSTNDSVTAGRKVITYDSLGTTAYIKFSDIFPGGVPQSPFDNDKYEISTSTPGAGAWTMSGDHVILTLTEKPSITIRDRTITTIINTFTP